MGGDRGGRGEEPGTCPWKVTSCHLLQRRKTGTNFPGEAIPLPPPPPPLELSGSALTCPTVDCYFLFEAGLPI